jgi:hypothetical protein
MISLVGQSQEQIPGFFSDPGGGSKDLQKESLIKNSEKKKAVVIPGSTGEDRR